MAHLTAAAHARLARQNGVITAAQLVHCDMHPRAIERLLANGVLCRAVTGAYRSPSVPWTEVSRCTAICLARPNLVISGSTAGRHWKFRKLPLDRRVHVIGPPRSQPSREPWIVVYRTAAIGPDDVVALSDGRRVTSRMRTVLDLSRTEPDLSIRSMIEQARSDGGHGIDDLVSITDPWRHPQRPWLRDFLGPLAECLPGGAAESHEEMLVGKALIAGGVRGLHRQFALPLSGRSDARFDLAVPALKWAMEVDVFPTHHTNDGIAADARRDDATADLGWITTRIGPAAFGPAFAETIDRLVGIHRSLR